jgi:surface protein
MFAYCRLLESVDLSKLDTSQCTSMASMFGQSGLKEIPVINNTSQCVTMSSLFEETPIMTADLRG